MKLKIGGKLFVGFGLIILLTAIISVTSFFQLKSVNNTYTGLLENESVRVMAAKDLLIETQDIIIAARGYLYSGNSSLLKEYEDHKVKVEEASKAMEAVVVTEDGKQLMQDIRNAQNQYYNIFDQIIEAMKNNKDYSHISANATKALEEITRANFAMADYEMSQVEEGKKRVTETVSNVLLIIMIISIVSIMVAVVIAALTARTITKPIITLEEASKNVASGDLSKEEIKVSNKDEIGDLANSFNTMVKNLRTLITEVSESSIHLASSAQLLTASAEQTSNAANESANTVSEMSNGIQQIAINAQEAAQASINTNKLADEGGRGVEEGIAQMRVIKESVNRTSNVIKELGIKSKSIGQIVDLITHIADQTNLLALNAAIEAARAGEQGRGFAVVAEEVRKLAEQSANAAKEITQLISEIQCETDEAVEAMVKGTEEVNSGAEVIDALGDSFRNILETVGNLSYRVQEVSAASQQMAASVENVAAAAEEQTASMQEVTASSETLNKMAEDLQSLVATFHL